MQCTSTFANFDDKIILVVATICGDEECPKNLGEHFKKGIWNSKTHPEDFNVLQKVYVQDLFTTASTEWARRVHSVLVRLACVHILEAKKVIFFKISS